MEWFMLKKRVIPVLLLGNGRMVKGRHFQDYRDVGDPTSAVRIYNAQYADELVFIDINPNSEKRNQLLEIICRSAAECFMPLTVGGGIKNIEDIRNLLLSGADKVIITTASARDPLIIRKAAATFGSQCIVAGIDYRGIGKDARVWINNGLESTNLHPVEHALNLVKQGAGEIFLNSIDRDGTMLGYDLETIALLEKSIAIPIVISGGAGNFTHLAEVFQKTKASGAACASLFHFGDNNPMRARSYLRNLAIPIRVVK